jgi:hypothetical protein
MGCLLRPLRICDARMVIQGYEIQCFYLVNKYYFVSTTSAVDI